MNELSVSVQLVTLPSETLPSRSWRCSHRRRVRRTRPALPSTTALRHAVERPTKEAPTGRSISDRRTSSAESESTQVCNTYKRHLNLWRVSLHLSMSVAS